MEMYKKRKRWKGGKGRENDGMKEEKEREIKTRSERQEEMGNK